MAYPFSAEALLTDFKIDLGVKTDQYDSRFVDAINTAMARITAAGGTLQDTQDDRDLVLMYGEWLWSCRRTREPMGRMLTLALNNKVLGQAARGGD